MGSVIVEVAEDGRVGVSAGLSGLGTSVADISGTDGVGSGCGDELGVVSMAMGVVGIAGVSISAFSSGFFSFLSKNLKHKS